MSRTEELNLHAGKIAIEALIARKNNIETDIMELEDKLVMITSELEALKKLRTLKAEQLKQATNMLKGLGSNDNKEQNKSDTKVS